MSEISEKDIAKAEKIFSGKSNRLITVSRFDKRKNHEKVIMALRNLKELYPNIIYVCIGYGEEENNLKKLVNELNLSNNVIFLKNIDNGLKNALVYKSNIFVMPSIIQINRSRVSVLLILKLHNTGYHQLVVKMEVRQMQLFMTKQV